MSDRQASNLPNRRTGLFIFWLNGRPLSSLLVAGLIVYSIIPAALSGIELASSLRGAALVNDAQGQTTVNFWDLLYFNFTTILTVGYGDYTPVAAGRLLSIFEAISGVVFVGFIIAIATIKVMQPPRHAIAFSRYGYYCTEEQSFLVIFANTTSSVLVNPEMCSYYRQGERWSVGPAYRAPFIRHSVWTFFIEPTPYDALLTGPEVDNALRFGITGQLDLTTASAYVEYEPNDIIVIRNRHALVNFKGFRDADFAIEDVRSMFNFRPQDSKTLREYQRAYRDSG